MSEMRSAFTAGIEKMIYGIAGGLGKGKTLLEVMLAYTAFEAGHKIYSNMHSTSDQVGWQSESGKQWSEYVTPDDFVKLNANDAYVMLDEVYQWLESRGSGLNTVRTTLTHTILQSRKLGFHIIYSLQLLSSVDKRLRNLTDYLFVTTSEFKYEVFDINSDNTSKTFTLKNPYDYFPLYNHKERVIEAVLTNINKTPRKRKE